MLAKFPWPTPALTRTLSFHMCNQAAQALSKSNPDPRQDLSNPPSHKQTAKHLETLSNKMCPVGVLDIGELRVSPRHRHRLTLSAPMPNTLIACVIYVHICTDFTWESMAMPRTPTCLNMPCA